MINYQPLENLLQLDFTQMRAKPNNTDGACATDEAITFFVASLLSFFEQFTQKPSDEVLLRYQQLMGQILEKINASELKYYIEKYSAQYPQEQALLVAKSQEIPNIAGIRKRMQYWAASAEWGGTLRNPQKHIQVVNKMDQWDRWLATFNASHNKKNLKRPRDIQVTQPATMFSGVNTFPQTHTNFLFVDLKRQLNLLLTYFTNSNKEEYKKVIKLLNMALTTLNYMELGYRLEYRIADESSPPSLPVFDSLLCATAYDYFKYIMPLVKDEAHRVLNPKLASSLSFFDSAVGTKEDERNHNPPTHKKQRLY